MLQVFIYLIILFSIVIIQSQQINDINSNENQDLSDSDMFAIYDDFPTKIFQFNVRYDHYTNTRVTRGHVQHLFYFMKEHDRKLSYSEFHRILQCPRTEPGLEGNRGTMSLLKMVPMSRKLTQLMCLWSETKCDWERCHQLLNKDFIASDKLTGNNISPPGIKLIRIINSTLYYDWPYKRFRFDKTIKSSYFKRYQVVLDFIYDIKDLLFLWGGEVAYLPHNYPFPAITASPTIKSMEFPQPWTVGFEKEYNLYYQAFVKNMSQKVYEEYHSNSYIDWKFNRLNKAAFYGRLTDIRVFAMDAATLRPDLIDAGWPTGGVLRSWNPLSTEKSWISGSNPNPLEYQDNITTPGYLSSLLTHKLSKSMEYLSKKYKYIIVVNGHSGLASTERLLTVLAHSGAVILLQTADTEYHFSARLKPWVHYVPIAYNTADIIRKIEWLQEHDEMAYEIAKNAKHFGQSYLRLEDYFCYHATLLKSISELFEGSDALIPFDPMIISNIPRFDFI